MAMSPEDGAYGRMEERRPTSKPEKHCSGSYFKNKLRQ
jgi:hypothetical protein